MLTSPTLVVVYVFKLGANAWLKQRTVSQPHRTPQECAAGDYMRHTLDGTAALLNSSKWFPSRVSVPETSRKYFASVARRLFEWRL
jgi:hypothetical protein